MDNYASEKLFTIRNISWFAGNRWLYFIEKQKGIHGIYMWNRRIAECRQVDIV